MNDTDENNHVLTVEDVSFSYQSPPTEAVRDINFSVEPGSFTAIVGPNGSGKTTLVNLIIGLLKPQSGRIHLMGYDPAKQPIKARHFVGYVPQHGEINLSPPLSVRQVVSIAADLRKSMAVDADKMAERVEKSLQMVELADLRDRPFKALSGGQRQRTLLARALVVDPKVLILDEPFAAVDAASQEVVSDLLHTVSAEKDVTVIVVVHDVNPICHFITHALLINNEQVAFGRPEEALTPDTLQEAYGTVVPILVCEEGYQHPVVHS